MSLQKIIKTTHSVRAQDQFLNDSLRKWVASPKNDNLRIISLKLFTEQSGQQIPTAPV